MPLVKSIFKKVFIPLGFFIPLIFMVKRYFFGDGMSRNLGCIMVTQIGKLGKGLIGVGGEREGTDNMFEYHQNGLCI